jgi:ACR3 family arsenite efflux pump ArsB
LRQPLELCEITLCIAIGISWKKEVPETDRETKEERKNETKVFIRILYGIMLYRKTPTNILLKNKFKIFRTLKLYIKSTFLMQIFSPKKSRIVSAIGNGSCTLTISE